MHVRSWKPHQDDLLTIALTTIEPDPVEKASVQQYGLSLVACRLYRYRENVCVNLQSYSKPAT